MNPRALIGPLLLAATIAVLGCGGSADPTTTEASTTETTDTSTTSGAPTSGCSPVETVDVEMVGTHFNRDFTAADYDTNPPTGGDHNPTPLEAGSFYSDPPRLGEAVHLLEHGAVIGWTRDLPTADQKAVEDAFDEEYSKGYYQLAVVENPDLDVPFALSSWGSLQKCDSADPEAIRSFIEDNYAPSSTAEGALACSGKAKRLPACAKGAGA